MANDRRAAPFHSEVEQLGARYLSIGKLSDSEVAIFRNSVASLAEMYRHHIQVEDELIFPLALRVLSNEEKSAIAREMAGRRQVTLITSISGGLHR